ncbi:unnamed protein product [Tenebrio molitor]|nr:unnamed protein product [Tenebrio molitor]
MQTFRSNRYLKHFRNSMIIFSSSRNWYLRHTASVVFWPISKTIT